MKKKCGIAFVQQYASKYTKHNFLSVHEFLLRTWGTATFKYKTNKSFQTFEKIEAMREWLTSVKNSEIALRNSQNVSIYRKIEKFH